ncbi:Uncharacterised protein [Edwardsiella ictaluri]|nr:Uncharacterised protein [Edwardsiella ictaluri]
MQEGIGNIGFLRESNAGQYSGRYEPFISQFSFEDGISRQFSYRVQTEIRW